MLDRWERAKIRAAIHYAIKKGRVVKHPCEVCGEEKSQAHHDDYNKPFDVRWLCQTHHLQEHGMLGGRPC